MGQSNASGDGPSKGYYFGSKTHHQDKRAFERWRSLLEKDQVERLMDKRQEYVVEGKWKPNYPSFAPELERPPSEAASSSHRAPAQEGHDRKGKERGKIYGHAAGRRTWEQMNNYVCEWQPQTSDPGIYAAKFRDGYWTDPRLRQDPGH